MFNCVLKSLSITELIAISEEVTNKEIETESIVNQLISKSNSPIVIGDKTMEEVRTKLTFETLEELCQRTLQMIENG